MISPRATTPIPENATRLPFRVRLSLLRQRIILTVRWWFRLPIDEIREQQLDTMLQSLRQESESLTEAVRLMKSMNARLAYYEQHIPRMRELRRQYDLEGSGIKPKTNGALHKVELIKP